MQKEIPFSIVRTGFLMLGKLEFGELFATPIGIMVGRGLDPAVVGLYVN